MSLGRFLRENAPWLAVGALLSFLSSFGQTFFIALFSAEIRESYGLSLGGWGTAYTIGTGLSALVMLWAGGMADRFRIRTLSITVVCLLALACFAMALNPVLAALPLVVFALRFSGQGMLYHIAMVAMSRWFVAGRGRALAVSTMGFITGEAFLPVTTVWLKAHLDWHRLWIGSGLICLAMVPVLLILLRRERAPQSLAQDNSRTGMDGKYWSRADALRHPLIWAIFPAILLFPAFGTAFWFHQVHFAEVKGWSHLSLVAVFPLGTGAFLLSTLAHGWAIDRFGCARLLPLYLLPLTLGFSLHWYAPSVAWSALGVILMGVSGGGQATLPAACWAEFFGTKYIGSIKAVVAAVMVLGSAIGPGLSGWLIDQGVAFPTQLLIYGFSFLIASALMVQPLRAATARLPRAA